MSSSAAGVHAIAATMTTVPAVGVQRYAWLMLAFPVFGALVLICGGRRTNRWGTCSAWRCRSRRWSTA